MRTSVPLTTRDQVDRPPVSPEDDDACRAVAEEINGGRAQWLVLWGCYSRQFVAFPLFVTRLRLIVYAGFPDALVARMDEIERRFLTGRPEAGIREGKAVPECR